MKFFIDCEFNEGLHVVGGSGYIELISIGVVSEDGKPFYREAEFNPNNSNEWVRENVWPHLERQPVKIRRRDYVGYDDPQPTEWVLPASSDGHPVSNVQIGRELLAFVNECILAKLGGDAHIMDERLPAPKFWADYGSYDWVRLCWLFGAMIDLPKGWPMFVRDLQQVLASLGNPKLPTEIAEGSNHNAITDAHTLRRAWSWLRHSFAGGDAMVGKSDLTSAAKRMLEA